MCPLSFRVTAGDKQLDTVPVQQKESGDSMSSKPKSIGIIGAPFSKGQVSESLPLHAWNLLANVSF